MNRFWAFGIIVFVVLIGAGSFFVIEEDMHETLRFWEENDDEYREVSGDEDGKEEDGPTLRLNEMTTDLRSDADGQTFYIQAVLELRGRDADSVQTLEDRMSEVKDQLLAVFRSSTPGEIKGEEGMDRLRERIKDRLNPIVAPGKIEAVYFERLIVQ